MYFHIQHFLICGADHDAMICVATIALVAMTTFDLLFLNGQHVYAVETITLELFRQFRG